MILNASPVLRLLASGDASDDKHKTDFTTRRGLFEFNVLPFGLSCARATFERFMESVLA